MIWRCPDCGAEWGEYEPRPCPTPCQATSQRISDLPKVPPQPSTKVASSGGSSGYYKIPEAASDLQDLIELKEMSFARGNIFKALYRMGEKAGIDAEYDLNKIQWFLDRLRLMHRMGLRL